MFDAAVAVEAKQLAAHGSHGRVTSLSQAYSEYCFIIVHISGFNQIFITVE